MSFIYSNKQLLDTLIAEGDKFVRKYGQASDAEIQQEYNKYKAQIETQRKQVETENARAEQFNKQNPNQPQKFIQTPPYLQDFESFKQSYQSRQTAQRQQANPTASGDALKAYHLAQKLTMKLQNEITPGSVKTGAPVDFATADGKGPALKPENAETLGDFLQWAANNKITWDGKRVAWKAPSDPSQPLKDGEENIDEPDAWVFQTYKTGGASGRSRDQYTREAETVEYNANKPALIAFITHLRDSDDTKKNKVLEVMLGKIIKQANQFLEKGEQIGPRAKPQAESKFKNDDLVDGFASSELDPSNPYAGVQQYMLNPASATVRLTYEDITDKGSFQDWLSGMKVKGAEGSYDPTAPGANPCPAIFVMYSRAKYLADRATDRNRANYKALASFYLKQMTEIGRQFSYKDSAGKEQPCALTHVGTAAAEKPGQKPGQPGSGQASNDPAALNNTIELLPLRRDMIDFGAIENFFKAYEKLLSVDESPRYNALAQSMHNAREAMSKAAAQTVRADQQYRMTNDLNHWKRLIQKQEKMTGRQDTLGTFVALTDWLQDVIEGTAYVIQELQAAYGKKVNATQAAQIAAQIGLGPGSSSIYGANSYLLGEVKRRAQAGE